MEQNVKKIVNSLNTGDLIFFSSKKKNSFNSFIIRFACHSKWTHVGMVIRISSDYNDTSVYIWESVNNNSTTPSCMIDQRTKTEATNNGVRLIDLELYLLKGIKYAKSINVSELCIGILPLDNCKAKYKQLQNAILQFVLKDSLKIKQTYPKSMMKLVQSWYDGVGSLFVCCGCYTTYEMQINAIKEKQSIDHNHYKKDETIKKEEVFCSQLVIETFERTGLFLSPIPCYEWTVDDLSHIHALNSWWKDDISYKELKEMIIYC